MIEFDKVTKRYGDKIILDAIDLQIDTGDCLAILGGSGAGKSTIINCINGLIVPDGGDVRLDGLSVSHARQLAEIRKKCATVFQSFNLYPHLTNIENITLAPIEVLGVKKTDAISEAEKLLDSVGLAEHAQKYPAQLSGGQMQRVGICRALAMSPDYLLLDEVTSSLDPEMTAEVVEVLEQLASEGRTMVMVTHELVVARKIATRIIFLEEGKVIADEHKNDFFSKEFSSANPRVRAFLHKSGEI